MLGLFVLVINIGTSSILHENFKYTSDYGNITITEENQSETFKVRIDVFPNVQPMYSDTFEVRYLRFVASAILNHFKISYGYSNNNASDSMYLQDYQSPNVFWHGRDSALPSADGRGPWFDDGDGGDDSKLWTVILSEFVQSIDWCLRYSTRTLFDYHIAKYRIPFGVHTSGWIIVFETDPHCRANQITKIVPWNELDAGKMRFNPIYQRFGGIIGRTWYPVDIARRQAVVAESNGFKGDEHPDSYILTKEAQINCNLKVLRKYRITWHSGTAKL